MKAKPKPPNTGQGAEPWRGRRRAWRGQIEAEQLLGPQFRRGGFLRTQRRSRKGS